MQIINAIISTILQVLIFTAIPFFVYLIKYRRARGFFQYAGLYQPERRTMWYAALFVIAVIPFAALFYFLPNLRESMNAPNTVTGQLRASGVSGTTVVLLTLKALFQTSLSEEILFRGFVAKRLINWMGFTWGNLLQALIFGAIHLLIFMGQAFSLPLALMIVLFPALGGWFTGFLNERLGNGSILPGWFTHGFINLLAYGVLTFG